MLYNNERIDFTQEPMFFGKGRNTQRFDVMKYSFFDERNGKMQGFDWAFDEAKLTDDYVDFNTKMQPHEQFAYTRTLQRLIVLDSLQGRGILSTLGLICSLPELENAMLTWQYFEGAKHSKTYTENLKGVYNNPTEIFDESWDIPEITRMSASISKPYNDAYKAIIEYEYRTLNNLEIPEEFFTALKKHVVRLLVSINILEGVRFYPGFSIIWALNKGQSYVEGTSKNLKFICRDENIHLSISQKIIQLLKTKEEEGFKDIFTEMEDEIFNMYQDAYNEESQWLEYLFSQGSFIGLNLDIAKEYLKYVINRRVKAIGYNNMFANCSKNPIPWIESYINMDKVEILPQEGEVTNYVSGGINNSQEATTDLYKGVL